MLSNVSLLKSKYCKHILKLLFIFTYDIYKLQHGKKTVIVQRYWNCSEFETAILSTQYCVILVSSWIKYLG